MVGGVEFLNYHHLRYFWVAAKEGGLTRAAEKLRVSQPSICTQIQALERALGEKLLRRTPRGLTLTEAGQKVFSFAEEIFSLGEDLMNTMRQRPSARPLRVAVGIADSLPKLLTYQMLKPIFHLPQPIQAACCEGKVPDLLGQLATYRLDIVLSDEPAPASGNLKTFNHLLGECGVSFCAEPKLAARLKRRFPRSLHEAPALLPSPNSALRRSLEKWFGEQQVAPRLVAEFDDAALVKVAATHGLGFFALPTLVAHDAVSRYGVKVIGQARGCRQQFFAISAERRLTHPAVVAITAQAQSVLG
ncbi:MAG TPA: LysR family transcriptional regulator [Verrucomicrobiota bacterium]|jgi:LysR family transcriptional activator of nhaA|nr:LysR family transcriptional regulator [Verrucomicrobiota bacterium]HRT07991.1 LysR family transcriptional regulator [Candidatus Paceibacterota bacterium]HRT56500.1 LysR family transcriptional regulator [Candidatus Paceibacterota bacterium]